MSVIVHHMPKLPNTSVDSSHAIHIKPSDKAEQNGIQGMPTVGDKSAGITLLHTDRLDLSTAVRPSKPQNTAKHPASWDSFVFSGKKMPVLTGQSATIGNIPITTTDAWRKMFTPKETTVFSSGNISDTAKQLSAMMDENREDMHWKIASGISEKELAAHFGDIGKRIDNALKAGKITQQEYDALNLGLEKYTESMVGKVERNAAVWAVGKQCAQTTRSMIKRGASKQEIAAYAQQHEDTLQSQINKFIKEHASIDRSLLNSLITRVRAGEQLSSQGTKHSYTREITSQIP